MRVLLSRLAAVCVLVVCSVVIGVATTRLLDRVSLQPPAGWSIEYVSAVGPTPAMDESGFRWRDANGGPRDGEPYAIYPTRKEAAEGAWVVWGWRERNPDRYLKENSLDAHFERVRNHPDEARMDSDDWQIDQGTTYLRTARDYDHWFQHGASDEPQRWRSMSREEAIAKDAELRVK